MPLGSHALLTRPSGTSTPTHQRKRRDVQGLRAVAVGGVILNHVTGWPGGGFVGVDVFFVISGYLITGQLLKDLARGAGVGRYLTDFYRRRVRRLFPAAFLTIVATTVAARFVLSESRAQDTLHDGGWAAVFMANWHLIAQRTNYFTATAPDSPFQHYWSLAVEEQFYIVWPLVLLVAARVAAARSAPTAAERPRAAGRRGSVAAVAVLIAGSLLIGAVQSTSDPAVAYFSSFTRGWELGLGALLALTVPRLRATATVCTALSWVGLALIAVALLVVHGGPGFPVPGAILPCIGAALAIAAQSNDGAVARNVLLTNRASVFAGDLSYSLYLVHFPVLVLLAAAIPGGGRAHELITMLTILAAAVVLHAVVERPVLDSRWLRPAGEPRSVSGRSRVSTRSLLALATVLALGATAVVLLRPDRRGEQLAARYQAANAGTAGSAANAGTAGSATTGTSSSRLAEEISQALAATEWPDLQPSIAVAVQPAHTPLSQRCGGATELLPAADCTAGAPTAAHTMYVVGDSAALGYADALSQMIGQLPGWKLRVAAMAGCEFSSVVYQRPVEIERGCPRHNADLVREINATHPDLVLVTNNHAGEVELNGTPASAAGLVAGVRDEVAAIRQGAGRIAMLEPPPGGGDPAGCYTPSSRPIECVTQVPALWLQIHDGTVATASSLGATMIDSRPWFCSSSGYCPPFVGHTPTMRDAVHASLAYATKLGPTLVEELRSKGLVA